MKRALRNIWIVARSPALEAIRGRDIYAIVAVAVVLLAGLRFVSFFNLEGLGKFYRDVSLKTMNSATALAAVLLAARQLPREIANRTLYPLLAKPISRLEFMAGKYIGVLFAAGFCYTLFMAIFLAANWTLRVPLRYDLFAQGVYLQFLSAAVIVALAFLLSLVLNVDAAITLSALLYFSSQVLMTLMSYIYDSLNDLQQAVVMLLHFLIPQLTLFDVSGRIVHGVWPALPFGVLRALTLYAAAYAFVFLAMAYAAFRRKSL